MEEASLLGELCHRQRVLPVCTARKARGVRRDSNGTEDVSLGCLTVKLRGRAEAPARRRGRTLSFGARGAQPPTHHGTLQRLLERMFVRRRAVLPRKQDPPEQFEQARIPALSVGGVVQILCPALVCWGGYKTTTDKAKHGQRRCKPKCHAA